MLYIDNKNLEVTKQNIRVGNFINNGNEGYNINIQLSFINIDTNEKGYINLDAGFEKRNDIAAFTNREYNGIPFDSNNHQFIFFEVFDTEKFLDTEIKSKIILKIKNMFKDKIKVNFELNDELIKIKYDGYLDIDFHTTKEIFSRFY